MKPLVNLSFILVSYLFLITVVCSARSRERVPYQQERLPSEIRNPSVQALSPRGLRVSIPDVVGLQLFAFHGKINARIGHLESGTLSKDVTTAKNGQWIFEDKTVSLRIGDVIHYWIFVQIDGLGHRVESLSAVINELLPCDESDEHEIGILQPAYDPTYSTSTRMLSTTTISTPIIRKSAVLPLCQECECSKPEMDSLAAQLKIATQELNSSNVKFTQLEKDYHMLRDILSDMLNDMNIGTKLLLVGGTPNGNSLEVVRNLITDKLGLQDLEEKIQSAQKTENGIVFEMSSPIDKKRILLKANKQLQSTSYKISDPEDPESLVNETPILDESDEDEIGILQLAYEPTYSTSTYMPSTSTYALSTPIIRKSTVPSACQECECSNNEINSLDAQLKTASTELNYSNAKLNQLEKDDKILRDLLSDMFNDINIGTKLMLVGETPPGNPLEVVRNLITDKLGLHDLEEKIPNAQKTENGIAFEMSSPIDKKRILLKANTKLQYASYKITDPQVPNPLVNIFT